MGIELESEAINGYGLEGFIDDNDAGDDSEAFVSTLNISTE